MNTQISDIVKVSIKELNLHKVEPTNEFEWNLVNNYLLEKCK
jgi:hypothetical protein